MRNIEYLFFKNKRQKSVWVAYFMLALLSSMAMAEYNQIDACRVLGHCKHFELLPTMMTTSFFAFIAYVVKNNTMD